MAFLVSAIASQAIGLIMGNFFNRFNSSQNTMESFLKTLSSDFTNKVENIVRAAFTDHEFLLVKSSLRASAEFLQMYTTSNYSEQIRFDDAVSQIVNTHSLMFEVAKKIEAYDISEIHKIGDNSERTKRAYHHIRSIESSLSALQAVGALYLTILAKKTETFPSQSALVVDAVDQYMGLANSLASKYARIQDSRTIIKFDHDIKYAPISFGEFKGTYFLDGNPHLTSKAIERYLPKDGVLERVKADQNSFQNSMIEKMNEGNKTNASEAENWLSMKGGIREAMKTWQAVQDVFKPNIQADLAADFHEKGDYDTAEAHHDRALWLYGNGAPAYMFTNAAITKNRLGKLEEADDLYSKGIQAYGDSIPVNVLRSAGIIKFKLKKWADAEELLSKAIKIDGEKTETWLLVSAGEANIHLARWEKADEFYTSAFRTCGKGYTLSLDGLTGAALAKFMLKQYIEADRIYTKIISLHKNNLSAQVLANGADTKFALKQYREADKLYTQALPLLGDDASPDFLQRAAKTKFYLGEYKEADVLFERAIKGYKNDVPTHVLDSAARAKFESGDYLKADELFTSVIQAYGADVPAHTLAYAAKVKQHLKKQGEADDLFTRAIDAYGIANAPLHVLKAAAYLKFELGQYRKAITLYTAAYKATRGKAPAYTMADILYALAFVHVELKEYAKARAIA